MKTALVVLAPGFEEVEALTPVDYLARAGIEVVTASLGDRAVVGSHGIEVIADIELAEIDPEAAFDVLVLPGGPGAEALAESAELMVLILAQAEAGRLLAAICAAPALVLAEAAGKELGKAGGLLAGRAFTCFPGYEARVAAGNFSPERVVQDGKILTSRAAGTAGEFSLAIVADLLGKDKAAELGARLLLTPVLP